MSSQFVQQREFSGILFDTLFGLILFFSLDSFLNISTSAHFIFYLFSTIILVDWWLSFKSADDAFNEEVGDSATDLIFGIIYIVLIEYIILMAKDFQYVEATGFLLALLVVDLFWALVWLYVGEWKTKEKQKIERMELELRSNIKINFFAIVLYGVLLVFGQQLAASYVVVLFVLMYLAYIFLQFKYKIIDLKIF